MFAIFDDTQQRCNGLYLSSSIRRTFLVVSHAALAYVSLPPKQRRAIFGMAVFKQLAEEDCIRGNHQALLGQHRYRLLVGHVAYLP